jgi:ATP adenylyltransferase
METIWAPWRAKYINKVGKMKGCIFCSKPKAGNDKKNLIVERTRHSFSVLNLYPYNNGHLMIVPFRHVDGLIKLTKEEISDLIALLNRTQELLSKTLHPDGFNIGINVGRAAGAGVKGHIHIHIVPRWVGDSNFMPVSASTKVISESLSALYGRLSKCARGKK